MVQLHQLVVVLRVVGVDALRGQKAGDIAPRPVEPARRCGGGGVARAVHAKLAPRAVIAEQRLEQLRPPRPVQGPGRGAGEDLGHRAVFIGAHAVIAEQPPGQRDGAGVGQGAQERRQAAVTHMDVHEFIDIGEQHPVGHLHQRVAVGGVQGGPLRALVRAVAVMRAGVADMGDQPHRLQPVEHQIGAVAAVVGKHQNVGEADGAVMGQPFQQEGRLVLHRCDQQRAHGVDWHRPGNGARGGKVGRLGLTACHGRIRVRGC